MNYGTIIFALVEKRVNRLFQAVFIIIKTAYNDLECFLKCFSVLHQMQSQKCICFETATTQLI